MDASHPANSATSSQVPPWPVFVKHILAVVSEETDIPRRKLREKALDASGISPEARAEVIPSGAFRASNRVDWAITHLSKAGYIHAMKRGIYSITDTGRKWYAENPEGIQDYSEANRVFKDFWPDKEGAHRAPVSPQEPTMEVGSTPTEQVEAGIEDLKFEVADELLERLQSAPPEFFEGAVVDLLLAMGYGGTERRGRRIGGSADGGVDGVIDQDALGLEQVYVQAKRYAAGNSVGREAVQAFIGALHGFGAQRGVFITTSVFTKQAQGYASSVSTRVRLLEGNELVRLMLKYRVGVQVKES
ncbi:restriction endonuclease [Nesterenkonia sphaerica]|uniref:Restriction endonuclease n=1 Tax=Nesterenkonia sphaerica TaxID=1804988 RepID=A0A5R9A121_9MICC|nr:restriction endonuclease [Nesterenkonia sphaerica]TLP71904.1 restriction endonuclease [Nesterenkonia sphaerica]